MISGSSSSPASTSSLPYHPPSICNDDGDDDDDDTYRISSSQRPRPRRRTLLPTILSSLVVIVSSLLALSYSRRSSSSSAASTIELQQQQDPDHQLQNHHKQRPGRRRWRRIKEEQRHLQQQEAYIEEEEEEEGAMEQQQLEQEDEALKLKREKLQRERRGQILQGDVLNVYSKGGCLYQKVYTNNKRVCTSEDPPEHATLGYCIDPSRNSNTNSDDPSIRSINPNGSGGIPHMEIRIYGQNWESVFFESWLLQIVLSELLHVPTSIETGLSSVNVDFYNKDNRFEYGLGDDWSCLITGSQVGDCRNLSTNVTNSNKTNNITADDSHQSCCHFVPENWNGFTEELIYHETIGTIEAATGIGTIGEEHWFVPKFTAERDPTLLSYVGLAGDENRPKLASRFQTPLTWYEYCTQISTTNCTIPDDVAQRPPKTPLLPAFTTTLSTTLSSSLNNTTTILIDEDDVDIIDTHTDTDVDVDESNHYYKEGLYTGYFHITPNNDCELNPSNCTGHIVDYPCGWSSFVIPTTYHLNIALQSNGKNQGASRGYYYNEMVEIILASNATKSDIIIMWWTPEAVSFMYLYCASRVRACVRASIADLLCLIRSPFVCILLIPFPKLCFGSPKHTLCLPMESSFHISLYYYYYLCSCINNS